MFPSQVDHDPYIWLLFTLTVSLCVDQVAFLGGLDTHDDQTGTESVRFIIEKHEIHGNRKKK